MMVNNGARSMAGRRAGESHIGGGAATIDEWMVEPLKALRVMHTAYDNIHVIGNSFGALSAMWSMTEKDAPLSKVRSLLLYAGAQGTDDGSEDSIMRIWQPGFLMAARITEKVTLNDPFDVVETLRVAYNALPERMKGFPAAIDLKYLVVERDELLRLGDTERFKAAIGGRGTVVIDAVDHAWLEHGLLAHDTPNYTTEDLLGLIRG